MRTIELEWRKTSMSQMDSMPNTYFYMLEYRGKIRYIGMTNTDSKQSVQEEIRSKKKIDKFCEMIDKATIWLGYKQEKTRYKDPILRFSNKNVPEIENLLIFMTKPELNSTCKTSYSGRDLRIVNTKCGKLLKETMAFENKKKRK